MVSSFFHSIVILHPRLWILSHFASLTSSIPFFQSEIEEALVRIKELEGVEGYVICNNDGTVLRHQVDMSKKVAEDLARVSLLSRIFLLPLLLFCRSQPTSIVSSSSNYTTSISTESNQACHTSHQRYTRSRSK